MLTEPLACTVHAIDRAQICGDKVPVIGAGPIGLLVAYLVRYFGASQLLIAERSEVRRNCATQIGFETLPSDKIPNGAFNVVLECAGGYRRHALGSEGDSSWCGGTIVWLGVVHPDAEVSIRPYELFPRELKILGTYTNPLTTNGQSICLPPA